MTYVAAITAILARYPEDVITTVTHPATGLPKKSNWLPTIKEVSDACEEAARISSQNDARLKRITEQMEARERDEAQEKPTKEQLKQRYGPNWGLNPIDSATSRPDKPAPSWDQIVANYQSEPGRLEALLKRDE